MAKGTLLKLQYFGYVACTSAGQLTLTVLEGILIGTYPQNLSYSGRERITIIQSTNQ